ncbi:MAG TPA: ATP-dependent helicase, partial [Candidatus Glassbacteria bacterium]|nr:ATP-dependent helicase [Candidatus Glassbacteria bacterium]
APGETAEAIAVVREVSRLVGGTGMLEAHGEGRAAGRGSPDELYSFSDVAVVTRTARLLEGLEAAFITEGIPCRLRGARSFLENPHVRNILAYLRLLLDPGDDLRFLGALRLAGFDPASALFSRVREQAAGSGRPLLAETKRQVSNEVPLKKDSGPAAEFLTGYDHFRRNSGRSPAELVGRLAERFVPEAERGGEPLLHLAAAAAGFASLPEFISRIVLATDGDLERPGGRGWSAAEAVTLMTMHAAKGLEFRVVFVCALEEGVVPFTWRETDPDEERRLLFVAMTRASRRLYLTSSEKRIVRGRPVRPGWSPFVAGLSADLVQPAELALPERSRDRQLGLL